MIEPNPQAILITNAIGIALIASLLITSHQSRQQQHLDNRIFTYAILIIGGACLFETVSWYADGNTEPWAVFLNYFGNTYCYIATTVYAYLWVIYVDLRLHKGLDRIRKLYPGLLVPTIVLSLLNLTSGFTGIMFTIDDGNVYSRMPCSYLNYAMSFASLFFSVWVKRRFEREHGHVRFFPLWMFIAPIFVGAGVQALFFGISLAWASVCVGYVSVFMGLQNELSYIDPLTNLYNRTYLATALQSIERKREETVGIMIDMDYFKSINDTFGHSAGDKALQQVAELLAANAPEGARVIRFAGDEFIVLLGSEGESRAEEMESAVAEAVGRFNQSSGKPYRLSLSMGHGTFVPGKDTTDDFLRRIDGHMYAAKRRKHEEGDRR